MEQQRHPCGDEEGVGQDPLGHSLALERVHHESLLNGDGAGDF